jgi:uncharacterized protein
METERSFTAFAGHRLIASGPIAATLAAVKRDLDTREHEKDDTTILIFEDATGAQVDFDLRGSSDEVLARLPEHPLFKTEGSDEKVRGGPGRPKLGVVSREVSLLPRHWQWLEAQSGGISGALRRLVDDARRQNSAKDEEHKTRDAIGRMMWSIAGDLPDFEEATRALFADDYQHFEERIKSWPADVRQHLMTLARRAVSFRASPD